MKIAVHFLSPDNRGYGVDWVEAENADELRSLLDSKSVTSWCRYSRCIATDDGQVHGEVHPLEELSDADLAWVVEKEATRSRFLSCVKKLR
jgi:hypothetical protein